MLIDNWSYQLQKYVCMYVHIFKCMYYDKLSCLSIKEELYDLTLELILSYLIAVDKWWRRYM